MISNNAGGFVYTEEIRKIRLEDLSTHSMTIDVVSLYLPQHIKARFNWGEIDTETRSLKLNKMTKEFTDFLRRYGLRVFIE